MKTRMECRSLGEHRSTYSNTNSSIRQSKQQEERHYGSSGTLSGSRSSTSSTGSSQSMRSGTGSSGAGSVAVSLLAGAGMGVLAGMLLAPHKGQVTRRRVADSASWVGRGITDVFNNSKNKVNTWTSKGRGVQRNASMDDRPRQGARNLNDEQRSREL